MQQRFDIYKPRRVKKVGENVVTAEGRLYGMRLEDLREQFYFPPRTIDLKKKTKFSYIIPSFMVAK
jgi:hypothetical protein